MPPNGYLSAKGKCITIRIMNRKLTIGAGYSLFVCALLASPAAAQKAPAPAPASAPQTGQSAAGPAKDYSSEPVVFETIRGSMRYENDGTGVRETSARVRVQTQLGLQRMGQLIFEYSGANEKMDVRKIRVIHVDGSMVDAGPDAIQDLTSPVAREAPMYTDARQKHVTVPGLGVGDVLEYDVVTTTTMALTPNQFWQSWNFINDAICPDEQVELNVPRDRPLKLDYPPEISVTQRDDGARRIYHWSSSTLSYPTPVDLMSKLRSKGKFDATALLEGVHAPEPRRVLFSTFQSWEEVGRWYHTLEGDRRTVTPDVRAKADEIVKGETSDEAKAQALYQWVSENIRYVSLSFGVGRYQPHGAAEVLTNRYGDCKDKATLLETLFEAEGLHADAVLINSGADVSAEVPSPLQFDHAINVIRMGGHDTWLDSTLGFGPFGYLLPQLRNKRALVVASSAAPSLQKTPSELTEPTIYRLEFRDSLNANKRRDLHIGFETRGGDLEVLLRAGLTRLSPEQMKTAFNQGLQSSAGRSATNISLEDITTSDPANTRRPLRLDARISGDDDKVEDAQGNPLPSMQPTALAALVGAMLPEEDESAKPPLAPVQLRARTEFSLALTFSAPTLPDEQKPDKQHTQISKGFATFSADREWRGQTLQANWTLNIVAPEVSKDQLADYDEFRKDVFASLDPRAAVNARVLESQVAADPKDGASFLRLGEAYSSMREYDHAVTNLKKATELLPKNGAAEFSLARAYLALHQDDNAIAAFERMIAIKNDGSTLNDAAYYLGEQKTHLDVAEKWAKQAIQSVATKLNEKTLPTIDKETAQLTGELAAYWDTLGWIKFHENDLPAAEKYIRAAWDIANYTDVGAHLGRVYEAEGKKDEAIEAYAQTLSLTGPSRELSENETGARRQLGSLVGVDAIAEKIKNAGTRLQARRTTEIANSAHLKGTGYFILIIDPKAAVADIKPAHPGNRLKDLTDVVHKASLPQSFPDDLVQKLPRAGMLNCSDADQPCKFTLMPPVPAAQVFPAAGGNPDE